MEPIASTSSNLISMVSINLPPSTPAEILGDWRDLRRLDQRTFVLSACRSTVGAVFVFGGLRRILSAMNLRLPPQHIALWQRWLLLALILLAFGRVTWRLGAQNFWWDESLSLQRAEQAWWPLIRGELVLKDGFSELMTIDQHPFFSFLLQGALVRLAGTSD